MKIKEQTIKEPETLGLSVVYELIRPIKVKHKNQRIEGTWQAYQKKVRDVLKHCNGSISNEILNNRANRA